MEAKSGGGMTGTLNASPVLTGEAGFVRATASGFHGPFIDPFGGDALQLSLAGSEFRRREP